MTAGRRILLIAYHFPPSAAVGGARMVSFATGLAEAGWDPRILTIAEENVEQLDRGRLAGLEHLPIAHAPLWPTLDSLYGAAKARLAAPAAASQEVRPHAPAASAGPRHETHSRRVRRWILSFLLLPDRERGWIFPATKAAAGQVRREGIGWIMTSCPPYSGHLVGLAVKGLTGARWVADFRDPWMTTGSKRLFPTSAASIRIESWLERQVMEQADLVLFNVERLRNAYRERYHEQPNDKFIYIPNAVTPRPAPDKFPVFTLAYTGSLYLGRSPEPVCRAVAQLIREGKTRPDAIRIKLIGHCREIEGVPTEAVARRHGLESVVEVGDPVPHREALEVVGRSHLALLFAPNLPFQIPAKAYDYLGAGTRILAIAEEGGTADLVRDTCSGQAFRSEDVEGIAAFIHHEMASPASPNGWQAAALARFEVKRVARELADELERVATAGGATG